jgi:hypothetical protein
MLALLTQAVHQCIRADLDGPRPFPRTPGVALAHVFGLEPTFNAAQGELKEAGRACFSGSWSVENMGEDDWAMSNCSSCPEPASLRELWSCGAPPLCSMPASLTLLAAEDRSNPSALWPVSRDP